MLFYEYGAFYVPPGINRAYHVTTALDHILLQGIVPRDLQKNSSETLGGCHNVSVSAYADIKSAFNTMVVLYRIFQMSQGNLSYEKVLPYFADTPSLPRVYDLTSSLNNKERTTILGNLCQFKDPIILSEEWLKTFDPRNLAIIEFSIEEEWLFSNYTLSSFLGKSNLPFYKYDGFQESLNNAKTHSSIFLGDGPVPGFYDKVKNAIFEGTSLEPYEKEFAWQKSKIPLNLRAKRAKDCYFGAWHPFDSVNQIDFGDFQMDFEPRYFDTDNIFEYYNRELEFRFFDIISPERFTNIYYFEDLDLDSGLFYDFKNFIDFKFE